MAPVHMNPAEAMQAHLALGARRSVGMHFGTFQLTDEAIDAPLLALEAARQAAGSTRSGRWGLAKPASYGLGNRSMKPSGAERHGCERTGSKIGFKRAMPSP